MSNDTNATDYDRITEVLATLRRYDDAATAAGVGYLMDCAVENLADIGVVEPEPHQAEDAERLAYFERLVEDSWLLLDAEGVAL